MMRSMAKAPVFKTSSLDVRPSGWKTGHRAPALGYGQLDGVCLDNEPGIKAPEHSDSREYDAPRPRDRS